MDELSYVNNQLISLFKHERKTNLVNPKPATRAGEKDEIIGVQQNPQCHILHLLSVFPMLTYPKNEMTKGVDLKYYGKHKDIVVGTRCQIMFLSLSPSIYTATEGPIFGFKRSKPKHEITNLTSELSVSALDFLQRGIATDVQSRVVIGPGGPD